MERPHRTCTSNHSRPPRKAASTHRPIVRSACTLRHLIGISALRDKVFVREKGYARHTGFNVPRFVDAYDGLPTTRNLYVEQAGRVVAAVRLLFHNPEIAAINGVRHGLDIEKKYRISAPPEAILCEVTRLCIDADCRGGLMYVSMLRQMRRVARAAGVTHFVASADLQTDSAADAAAVCAAEIANGHTDRAFRLELLSGEPAPPATPTRPLPRDGEAVQTGATLRTFLRSGAVIIGPPRPDEMGTFAVPIALPIRR